MSARTRTCRQKDGNPEAAHPGTARRQSAAEWADHYRELFDTFPIAYATVNSLGTIIEANHAFGAMFGVVSSSLPGRALRTFINEEAGEKWRMLLTDAIGTGVPCVAELPMRRENGTGFHARLDCLYVAQGRGPSDIRIAISNVDPQGTATDQASRLEQALWSMTLNLEAQLATRNAQLESRIAELARLENFNRATLDSLNLAIGIVDENGEFMFRNRVWQDYAAMAAAPSGTQSAERCCKYVPWHCEGANGPECLTCIKLVAGVEAMLKGRRSRFSLEHERTFSSGDCWFLTRLTRLKGSGPLRLIISHENITERKIAANEALKAARNFKSMLRSVEAEHEGRSRELAREVHDQLGATLTMLKLGMATAIAKSAASDEEKAKCHELLELANLALKTVKRVTARLRPPMLDTLGLGAALRCHCREFAQTTGIDTSMRMREEEFGISPARGEQVFRIVQEALTNVAKHGRASKASVVLRQDGQRLIITVVDNGIGLRPGALKGDNSFGILGMRERAEALQGRLSISNRSPSGVRLSLSIPLEPAAAGRGMLS